METNNFIEVYKNAFSKEYCNAVIKYFEDMQSAGCVQSRQEHESGVSKLDKDNYVHFATDDKYICLKDSKAFISHFNEVFWRDCYNKYAEKYEILKECAPHSVYSFKIQKTEVGGGYHVWHSEAMNRASSCRLGVWMLYLNDIDEGGETEFLYQHKRFKPEAGSCLIWPAAYTHAHRGNPPLSGSKYIVTGWLEF